MVLDTQWTSLFMTVRYKMAIPEFEYRIFIHNDNLFYFGFFPPKIEPFLCHFQVNCMLKFLILINGIENFRLVCKLLDPIDVEDTSTYVYKQ